MKLGRGQWEAMRTGSQAHLTQEVSQGRSNLEKFRLRICVCDFSLLKTAASRTGSNGHKISAKKIWVRI